MWKKHEKICDWGHKWFETLVSTCSPLYTNETHMTERSWGSMCMHIAMHTLQCAYSWKTVSGYIPFVLKAWITMSNIGFKSNEKSQVIWASFVDFSIGTFQVPKSVISQKSSTFCNCTVGSDACFYMFENLFVP